MKTRVNFREMREPSILKFFNIVSNGAILSFIHCDFCGIQYLRGVISAAASDDCFDSMIDKHLRRFDPRTALACRGGIVQKFMVPSFRIK